MLRVPRAKEYHSTAPVIHLLRTVRDVGLLGEHHGRILDRGQRLERGPALALRPQG